MNKSPKAVTVVDFWNTSWKLCRQSNW